VYAFALPTTSYVPTRHYITGNGFKALADYIIKDATPTFTPETVPAKSIIYIRTNLLGYFFNTIFPRIQHPVILISHNSDMPAPGVFASYLNDPRIIMWFGQNCDITQHPKFFPIPIGIPNPTYNQIDMPAKHGDTSIFDRVLDALAKNTPIQRQSKLYLNFSPNNNPIRMHLYKLFDKKDFITSEAGKNFAKYRAMRNLMPYLSTMSKHRYTLSPFGAGLDCYRTWEALLVGSMPVVKTSTLDPLYKDLPVIIVDEWEDITLPFLNKKYDEMQTKIFNREKLFMDYWVRLIKWYASSDNTNTNSQKKQGLAV
jgi:hypothetical protein